MAIERPFKNEKFSAEKSTSVDVVPRSNIYLANRLSLNVIDFYQVYVQCYVPYILTAIVVLLSTKLASDVSASEVNWDSAVAYVSQLNYKFAVDGLALVMLVAFLGSYLSSRKSPVYCVEFETFTPPESWKVTRDEIMQVMRSSNSFTEESQDFLQRIMDTSATGNATHWPPGILKALKGQKQEETMTSSRREFMTVMAGCIDQLIERTKIDIKNVDFLVVNCSLFSPTPSLCAMISNHYGMKSSLQSFNLGGMGCSAGLISVDLAKQLLENNPGKTAIVFSTETISEQLYHGNERSMLLQNTLFRVGGSAALLSSKWKDGLTAKYKLLHTVRTQHSNDLAYNAVYQCEDKTGEQGIRLSKDIVSVAGKAMTTNLTSLGPYVLPVTEQVKVLYSMLMSFGRKRGWVRPSENGAEKHYVPNFKAGVQHFCIHAGGRAVIEGIQKNLQLSDYDTEPSRETLHNFGNTSSSSIWYEMRWLEDHDRIKRGDRTLQLAFGSGFKCNSAVWLRLR
ncbi:hypothetical protein SARC_08322 [Sphaeroforma arctica JP610]|uniref:3-ketoacyl-CoA synthase n=1 Tax=Sphaeroforma arctica JP610 TaxID=667725 RepID=A0A0L0FRG2_9EUKA|nr:hypothetical protein SARC_08322 [Sphaeroforma arctica JP610]KNC79279.1 hypothetical protein SARC_08322 [Sphaeroforma arctica JP610]|eukprot:XP_014153181.1 hypothetical protein SARC_08322 [Sphaeroforma arctica JP610]